MKTLKNLKKEYEESISYVEDISGLEDDAAVIRKYVVRLEKALKSKKLKCEKYEDALDALNYATCACTTVDNPLASRDKNIDDAIELLRELIDTYKGE